MWWNVYIIVFDVIALVHKQQIETRKIIKYSNLK